MDVSSLKTDESLESEGVWFDYRDGSKVKVASIGSRKFQKIHEALKKPYERLIRMDALDSAKQDELTCKAMSKALLMDWKGFSSGGKSLPFSQEAAFQLLMDSRIFRNDIMAMALEEEAYKKQQAEQAEKNSKSSSESTPK